MRKKISWILIFVVIFSIIPMKSYAIENSDVKYIYTINDFQKINDDLSGHYVLMNDLDFSGVKNWKPIGDSITYLADKVQTGFTEKKSGKYFKGVFDGNGFTIKNFSIESTSETKYNSLTGETLSAFGLFSHLSGALIKNLNFSNIRIDININDNAEKGSFAKKIIAASLSASSKNSVISNCNIDSGYFGCTSSKSFTAGLVAIDLGECTYDNITNNANGYMDAGIIYSCDCQGTTISNCTNNGDIWGIAGIVAGGRPIISNCKNTGNITGGTAGIIGHVYNYTDSDCMQINDCINTGSINCTLEGGSCIVGGIVGEFDLFSGSGSLLNCQNYGDIYIKPTDNKGGYISAVGGVAGQMEIGNVGDINISNCENNGDVICDLINCPISKSMNLGGVIGEWHGSCNYEIKKIINNGNIKIQNFNSDSIGMGGIIGYAVSNVTLKEVLNRGDLFIENSENDGTGQIFIGGVLCGSSGANLDECGNEGNIFASGNIRHILCGGLIQTLFNSDTLSNVYNSGDIRITDSDISDDDILRIGGLSGVTICNSDTPVCITNVFVKGNIELNRAVTSSGRIDIGSIYAINPQNSQIVISNCYINENLQSVRVGNGDKEIIDNIQSIANFSLMQNFIGFDFSRIWEIGSNGCPILMNATYDNALLPTITLSITSKTMSVGETAMLTATTTPGEESIRWTSSNTNIVTVLGGIITAKAAGTATITAKFTYNGMTYSKTCSVMVISNVLLGDVNDDGEIDAADAGLISRYDAGFITLTSNQLKTGDVNKDGVVDAADAGLISRYDAGFISTLE